MKKERFMARQSIFDMKVSKIYPLLLQKVERKGRSKEELDAAIAWLTGYDKITDIDAMKIQEQKRATRDGYDRDIIPSDINAYGGDAKNLLSDLMDRNKRVCESLSVNSLL